MKKTGAQLVRFALEEIGVKFTFGIPGVHTTELYDELGKSKSIKPILTTHELCASFMADAVSRTSSSIGTILVVPGAGITHAMSGIAEAFLDGIPMLVISSSARGDTEKHFQLHQIDQINVLKPITKKTFRLDDYNEIISTIYEAYEIAISGTPGPVFLEIPAEIQYFLGDVEELASYVPNSNKNKIDLDKIEQAVNLLKNSNHPGLYLGWGARNARASSIKLAELLNAPVSTTMQGLGSFPADHPLHTGMGFGAASVPASEKAFANCDCLLAVGARFSELATASYSLPVPKNLIHIDINGQVFNKNYEATISIEGDAGEVLKLLLNLLEKECDHKENNALIQLINLEKNSYKNQWIKSTNKDKVSPGHFFNQLDQLLESDAIITVDSGNHTFLTAELLPISNSRVLISPTDFNAMGYAVPAAIGAKFSNPKKRTIGIVGDGAFMMTGLETLTASTNNLGVVYFVFKDGELAQISQFQKTPFNRKTCTVLGKIQIEGVAKAVNAKFLKINNDSEITNIIKKSFEFSDQGTPVIVEVNIDYSKKTRFTKAVIVTNLKRMPFQDKVRILTRAASRRFTG